MNLRKLAEGQDCLVRIPGHCNFDNSTTILAHLRNQWFGAGSKPPDILAVHACSSCHDIIDGRVKVDSLELPGHLLMKYIYDAYCRQILWYVKNDILKW